MCDYCKLQIYIKVQQFLRPASAPLTRADALIDEYTNITGMAYVPLQKRFCPMWGRKLEVQNDREVQ